LAEEESILLKGKLPDLRKMNKEELKGEVEVWRNLWGWLDSGIRYYLARTGHRIALTTRNYKRYLGVLMETHWELKEIEVGVYDKVYDARDGKYYFERKIIKLPQNNVINLEWIKERHTEEEMAAPEPVSSE